MKCPKCKLGQLSRVKRQGILEDRILPRLGYFPWECSMCRKRLRVRTRGWQGPSSSAAESA